MKRDDGKPLERFQPGQVVTAGALNAIVETVNTLQASRPRPGIGECLLGTGAAAVASSRRVSRRWFLGLRQP